MIVELVRQLFMLGMYVGQRILLCLSHGIPAELLTFICDLRDRLWHQPCCEANEHQFDQVDIVRRYNLGQNFGAESH